jgi:hypothetical protein
LTLVKKLAATEAYTAEPPKASFTWPKGVFTVSKATEPTTSKLIIAPALTKLFLDEITNNQHTNTKQYSISNNQ